MNKFYMEFLNGHIKSSLRLARKIKMVRSWDEAEKLLRKSKRKQ